MYGTSLSLLIMAH